MLDSTSLTRAWLALPLKVMASVPPPVVSVPTVTPEMITSPPAVNTTLPRALQASAASAPVAHANVTLAPA